MSRGGELSTSQASFRSSVRIFSSAISARSSASTGSSAIHPKATSLHSFVHNPTEDPNSLLCNYFLSNCPPPRTVDSSIDTRSNLLHNPCYTRRKSAPRRGVEEQLSAPRCGYFQPLKNRSSPTSGRARLRR